MLTTLRLNHFRCHAENEWSGFGEFNLLTGPNGAGKSSILEAIHLLSRCRSYRTRSMREMLSWQQPSFRVEGHFAHEQFSSLRFQWSTAGRILGVDAIEKATLAEFWGNCMAVVFHNRDLDLVTGTAKNRRQWMDSLIAQIDPRHLLHAQHLQKILEEKNALLKQDAPSRPIWDALHHQLHQISRPITQTRQQFSQLLTPLLHETLHTLNQTAESVEIRYHSDYTIHADMNPDDLFAREAHHQSCRIGPQRDDWHLLLNGKNLRDYGSEGQQRSVALAMRFAELLLLRQRTNRTLLLLIDDVLHELDSTRSAQFWKLLPTGIQTFYACTEPPPSLSHTLAQPHTYLIGKA